MSILEEQLEADPLFSFSIDPLSPSPSPPCYILDDRRPVPPGFVLFTVWRDGGNQLVLRLPLAFIHSVVFCPLKYLAYVAWCICGQKGEIRDAEGNAVDMSTTTISEGCHFQFVSSDTITFEHTANPALTQIRSLSSLTSISANYKRSSKFSKDVSARDGQSVFTIHTDGEATHLLPHRLGDDFADIIKTHRLPDFDSIDDIRNGIFLETGLHITRFEKHRCAILYAPNEFLTLEDLKDADPEHISEQYRRKYPNEQETLKTEAYVFHWLVGWPPPPPFGGEEVDRISLVAHCARARFADLSKDLPHPTLCHIRYGLSLLHNMIDEDLSETWLKLQRDREKTTKPSRGAVKHGYRWQDSEIIGEAILAAMRFFGDLRATRDAQRRHAETNARVQNWLKASSPPLDP
ncbi:hypothetical protein E1B28_001924 [Marasmius oreades]|uniref:HNH nuclease domain-containing protein n=1 Tax=Marasmius oreades TaxID=181124 RepID=A0A9P7V4I5_9AGAR|nr:uncharacterized protein E1B28_001924 [Marasmius oreades]KAG7100145.1 hypothetical protein E1B28_001924 [Marasmius oreades]